MPPERQELSNNPCGSNNGNGDYSEENLEPLENEILLEVFHIFQDLVEQRIGPSSSNYRAPNPDCGTMRERDNSPGSRCLSQGAALDVQIQITPKNLNEITIQLSRQNVDSFVSAPYQENFSNLEESQSQQLDQFQSGSQNYSLHWDFQQPEPVFPSGQLYSDSGTVDSQILEDRNEISQYVGSDLELTRDSSEAVEVIESTNGVPAAEDCAEPVITPKSRYFATKEKIVRALYVLDSDTGCSFADVRKFMGITYTNKQINVTLIKHAWQDLILDNSIVKVSGRNSANGAFRISAKLKKRIAKSSGIQQVPAQISQNVIKNIAETIDKSTRPTTSIH